MKSFSQFLNEKDESPEKPRFRGRKAERIKGATGGKKTGSLRAGNISFPGDRSGAYKATKSDIETRKGFSKNKPGGLKADETNKFVKTTVRKGRVDDLGGDIYNQPKFSQKKFDKSIKSLSKGPKTNIPNPFGKGITKGQANVKGLESKSFKKTKPSDIKLPKSFTNFGKKLQDFKDRDLPGGPRKTTTTKPKTSSPSLTRQDVGMAPSDKPKVIKQSEVSKNIKKTNKFSEFRKEAEVAKNKYRADVQKTFDNKSLEGKQKSKQTRVDMAKVKKSAELEKGYKLASQGKGNLTSGIVKSSNLDVVKSATKVPKVTKVPSNIIKVPETRATPSNPKGVPPDVMKQMKDIGYDKPGSARKGYTGSFRSFKQRVKDNLAVQDISKKPIKTPGGKLVTAGQMKDSAIVKDAARPKKITIGTPTRSAASKMTKFPKIGKNLKSTWATRGYGKQAGALFGVSTGINKYKQEIKKGKSKASAATSATLKGGASGLGSYAGALIGKKVLGKPGMMVGSAIGSSVGERGYEIANNLKNITTKAFKNFRKKSPNNIKKSNPSSKGLPKFRLSSD